MTTTMLRRWLGRHRLAWAKALGTAALVAAAAAGNRMVVAAAAVVAAGCTYRLARRRGAADARRQRAPASKSPAAATSHRLSSSGPGRELVTRLVDLQLDYLTDLDSCRVLPRALDDLLALARASFGVIGEVRVSSSGVSYVEVLESSAVCWSDSPAEAVDGNAFRAVSRDVTPVLDAVAASGESQVVDRPRPRPGLSGMFLDRGCLALPLRCGARVVGVVALGEVSGGPTNDLVEMLTPYLQVCAGLIDAARHQAQHEQVVEEAKARETLYRDLFESASDLIHAVRPDGGFAYVNKAWLRTLGYTESDLGELRVWDVVDESAHGFYRTVFAQASRGLPAESRAMTFIAKDGRRIAVEGVEGCRFVDGVPAVTRAIFRDMTRRNAEEDALRAAKAAAEEAARAKDLFLANMSHELRTPMNAVIGMADLMAETSLSADQQEFVHTIRKAGENLLDVINNVLDFSKIESGKLQLERVPFDLRDAIEDAIDLVAKPAAEKGLELAYVLTPGTPQAVLGDVTRVKQILINLVTNAVKFTARGEVVVSVEGHVRDQGYELHIGVRDTGIGIPADRVDRLFQSFSQVDDGITRQFGGTGLGLAISRRLAELMGGTIWVESRPGIGSVFHVTLVVERDPASGAHQPNAQGPLVGKRVLVIAQGATMRRIVLDHATAWGMKATALVGVEQALADLELGAEYDLVVLDTSPRLEDAVSTLRQLRRRERLAQLPAVLLGAVGRAGEVSTDLTGYVWATKPIKQRTLQRALRDAIEGCVVAPSVSSIPAAVVKQPHRLLLVEDNPINQQVAFRMLSRLGYVADLASNGAEAVDATSAEQYDIVLMDVQMPVLDGFAATREIRSRRSDHPRPHIIGMTALALPGDRERCLASGMDGYVSKPLRLEALKAALEHVPMRHVPRMSSEASVGPLVVRASERACVADDEVPLWDHAAVGRLVELAGDSDPMFTQGLIDRWRSEYPQRLADIGTALAASDVGTAERVAHTLKSTCGLLGAMRMAACCEVLERAARTGQIQEARGAWHALEAAAAATDPLVVVTAPREARSA